VVINNEYLHFRYLKRALIGYESRLYENKKSIVK
jgi:hypothetical protein